MRTTLLYCLVLEYQFCKLTFLQKTRACLCRLQSE